MHILKIAQSKEARVILDFLPTEPPLYLPPRWDVSTVRPGRKMLRRSFKSHEKAHAYFMSACRKWGAA